MTITTNNCPPAGPNPASLQRWGHSAALLVGGSPRTGSSLQNRHQHVNQPENGPSQNRSHTILTAGTSSGVQKRSARNQFSPGQSSLFPHPALFFFVSNASSCLGVDRHSLPRMLSTDSRTADNPYDFRHLLRKTSQRRRLIKQY